MRAATSGRERGAGDKPPRTRRRAFSNDSRRAATCATALLEPASMARAPAPVAPWHPGTIWHHSPASIPERCRSRFAPADPTASRSLRAPTCRRRAAGSAAARSTRCRRSCARRSTPRDSAPPGMCQWLSVAVSSKNSPEWTRSATLLIASANLKSAGARDEPGSIRR